MVDQVEVVVAGGGPVGMTLAHELGRRGVRCLLAERNASTTTHPKMDITNGRSMELFRRAGLDARLRAVAVPEDHNFDVAWITTLAGWRLHRFAYSSVSALRQRIRATNDGTQTAEPPMRVSQVIIEPVLKAAIDAAERVDVRFGWAFERFEQDDEGVTTWLRDASGETQAVRSRYLVGCDGGGSRVRRQLDIGLAGRAQIAERCIIHFESDDRALLQRWGAAWHYQSDLGTLVAQDDRRVWTLLGRSRPGLSARETDPEVMLETFAGRAFPHRTLLSNDWAPNLLVADRYGEGRVLLAGDAVHQYVPTGGYGMNTGVGDAFDLGWKLAAVLRGFGGPGLVDAYEAERRPIGLRNCAASGRHVGVRGEIAALYGPELHLPSAEGDATRSAAGATIAALGNAENESFGIEHGYVYAGSPLVEAEPGAHIPDDPIHYQPTTLPGVRLPSVVLEDGEPLYDRLGDWFTLLLVGDGDASGFADAAAELGVPLKVVRIEAGWRAVYAAALVLVRPDQHVAWRGSAADAAAASAALRRALGWQNGPDEGAGNRRQ